MIRPPASCGMCSTPRSSRPNHPRASPWMAGRKTSRIGVRCTAIGYKKTGPGSLPAPQGIALEGGLVVVLVAATHLDRRQLLAVPLDAVLAADTGLNLGQRLQAGGRDLLPALHAGSVLAVIEPVERRGQRVHSLHQQLAGRKPDLP